MGATPQKVALKIDTSEGVLEVNVLVMVWRREDLWRYETLSLCGPAES